MRRGSRQAGSATVEFALVFILLLAFVIGLVEVGRLLYVWSSSVDATRQGARAASIASPDAAGRAQVIAAMRLTMQDLRDEQVSIQYSTDGIAFGPAGTCTRASTPPCVFVRVSIAYTFTLAPEIWSATGAPFSLPMPTFSTTAPVEALGAT